MLLWAVAKEDLVRPEEPMMAELVARTKALGPPRLSAAAVGQLAWACARLEVRDPDLLSVIADRAVQNFTLQGAGGQTTSTLVWSLATLGLRNATVFRVLRERAMEPAVLTECNAQDVSLMFSSFARLELRDVSFFNVLAERSLRVLYQFRAQNIGAVIWAMGTLGVVHERMLRALLHALLQPVTLTRAQPQSIAVSVWGLAKLGFYDADTMETIAAYLCSVTEPYDGRFISMIAWAYATLRVDHPPLMRRLAAWAASPKVSATLSSQSIANLVWAFSSLGVLPPAFFYRLADRAMVPEVLETFTGQGTATTLWAFAQLPERRLDVVDQLMQTATATGFADFQLPSLAMTAWALADVNWYPDPATAEAMARRCAELMASEVPPRAHGGRVGNGRLVALILAAFTRLDLCTQPLVDRIVACVERNGLLAEFMAQEVSLVSWALSVTDVDCRGFVPTLADRAAHFAVLADYHPRTLQRTLDALVVLDVNTTTLAPLRYRQFLLDAAQPWAPRPGPRPAPASGTPTHSPRRTPLLLSFAYERPNLCTSGRLPTESSSVVHPARFC
eukprot:TRINITY_DN2484_c0_g1_i1.p1 TRINITY_DN2484_c0_g1~~TRINITY_DN2484_c0_g1_i1.p1  ORF type:complete len:562 (+),score=159.99 TRINITY_DN2484_c0_g1_i1:137-1822(+)